jgi:hypothetical protein
MRGGKNILNFNFEYLDMYYKLKYGKNYIIKIILLVLVALLAEYLIWWALVREESVDWIAGHINHVPSPYAISEMDDGRKVVANVVLGFELLLSDNWEVKNGKNPIFYFKNKKEEYICEVKSEVKRNVALEEKEVYTVKKKSDFYTYIKEESMGEEYLYEYLIEIDEGLITYNLYSNKENKVVCKNEFEKIINTWFYYPAI